MSIFNTSLLTSLATSVMMAPSYARVAMPSPVSEPSMLSIMVAIGMAGLLFKMVRK